MPIRSLLASLLLTAANVHAADTPALPAEAVEQLKDLDYVGDGNPKHQLDLLLPKDRAGKKLPLVIFIHGGSWSGGSRQDGMFVVRALAAAGYAAATISYRLSDEAPWPAQIFDCKAAIRFLRGKAADYQIDPDHIGVAGMSAGGHLASIVGTAGDVKELEGTLGSYPGISSRVECVVNYFGPENFQTIIPQSADHPILSKMGQVNVTKLLGGTVADRPEQAKQASPVTWVSRDDPPFLTAHGDADPIVPIAQAHEIHDALKNAGVESHLFTMQGQGHGFANDKLNLLVMQFLNQHLRGQKAGLPEEMTIAPK